MTELPKVLDFQSKFYQRMAKRVAEWKPRVLTPSDVLNVNLATREVGEKKRMNWNPEALRRLMNGKQEKNPTCETFEFESQKGERL